MSVNELSCIYDYIWRKIAEICDRITLARNRLTLLSALKGRVMITKVIRETSFSNSFNISSLLNKGRHTLNFIWRVLLRFSSYIYFIYLFILFFSFDLEDLPPTQGFKTPWSSLKILRCIVASTPFEILSLVFHKSNPPLFRWICSLGFSDLLWFFQFESVKRWNHISRALY